MMNNTFVIHRRAARNPLIGTETVVAFLAQRGMSILVASRPVHRHARRKVRRWCRRHCGDPVIKDEPITRIYAIRNLNTLGRLEEVAELRRRSSLGHCPAILGVPTSRYPACGGSPGLTAGAGKSASGSRGTLRSHWRRCAPHGAAPAPRERPSSLGQTPTGTVPRAVHRRRCRALGPRERTGQSLGGH
jgi:hypothetical protein